MEKISEQPNGKMYINSLLMKQDSDDDTTWYLDLGNNYSVIIDNEFVNFNGLWGDFSFIYVDEANNEQKVSVQCDQCLKLEEFKNWFNSNSGGIAYEQKIQFTSPANLQWRIAPSDPKKNGWAKLGITNKELSIVKLGDSTYDFSQTPCIFLNIQQFPKIIQTGYGNAQFQILNNSGGRGNKIIQQYDNLNSNQQITFNSIQNVRYLSCQLLDCDLQRLTTISNNRNDIECIFVFSLFL